jgi:DNA mismatch endonuclease (patch repair protein)
LPGRPDLVLPGRRAVILIHGCFWHQHARCREGRPPASNRTYWLPKLARNVARDRKNVRKLRRLRWRVLTVWECDVHSPSLGPRIARFLQAGRRQDS